MRPSKSYLRQEMRRYLHTVPDATPEEIADLKEWVEAGNDPYCNPSHIADGSGWEMPFIHGLRAEQELVEMMTEGLIDPPNPLTNLTCSKRGLCPRTPGV